MNLRQETVLSQMTAAARATSIGCGWDLVGSLSTLGGLLGLRLPSSAHGKLAILAKGKEAACCWYVYESRANQQIDFVETTVELEPVANLRYRVYVSALRA